VLGAIQLRNLTGTGPDTGPVPEINNGTDLGGFKGLNHHYTVGSLHPVEHPGIVVPVHVDAGNIIRIDGGQWIVCIAINP